MFHKFTFQIPQDLNQVLIHDLEDRLGCNDLLAWIELKTTEIAQKGWNGRARVDIRTELLRAVGVGRARATRSSVENEQLAHVFARIQPVNAHNYEIIYRPIRDKNDQRFWLAHEIAHTFWFSSQGNGLPLSRYQLPFSSDKTIEWLCNRAAAALLLPRGLLEHTLRQHNYLLDEEPPPLHLIATMALAHAVNTRLLVRRWIHELCMWDVGIICLKHIQNSTKNEPYWKILWSEIPGYHPGLGSRLYDKRVPSDFLPKASDCSTEQKMVDGRWHYLLNKGIFQQKIPMMRKLPKEMKECPSWITSDETFAYLAIPFQSNLPID